MLVKIPAVLGICCAVLHYRARTAGSEGVSAPSWLDHERAVHLRVDHAVERVGPRLRGGVTVAVPLAATDTLKLLPSSEVTVCPTESLLRTVSF